MIHPRLYQWLAMSALIVAFAGCGNNDADLNATNLEPEAVVGSSFDEPATVIAEPAVDTPASLRNEPSGGTITVASAADITDISKIPTATPVPRPGEEEESSTDVQPAAVEVTDPVTEVASVAFPDDSAEFETIPFTTLTGYTYVEPIPQEGSKPEDNEAQRMKDQIPADVKALNGKDAVIQGWMVPMEVSDDGSVKSFVLVNTQPQCCFGDTQMMNEWIDVVMAPGKSAEFNVDRPVKVFGRLEIGEKTEDGFVLSIYRMKAIRAES